MTAQPSIERGTQPGIVGPEIIGRLALLSGVAEPTPEEQKTIRNRQAAGEMYQDFLAHGMGCEQSSFTASFNLGDEDARDRLYWFLQSVATTPGAYSGNAKLRDMKIASMRNGEDGTSPEALMARIENTCLIGQVQFVDRRDFDGASTPSCFMLHLSVKSMPRK